MKRSALLVFLFFTTASLYAESTPRSPEPCYNSATGGVYILYKFYHYLISSQDGPRCIYTPTCSAYAAKAMSKHGIIFGSLLASDRLIRCNPSHNGGEDKVPETVIKK